MRTRGPPESGGKIQELTSKTPHKFLFRLDFARRDGGRGENRAEREKVEEDLSTSEVNFSGIPEL